MPQVVEDPPQTCSAWDPREQAPYSSHHGYYSWGCHNPASQDGAEWPLHSPEGQEERELAWQTLTNMEWGQQGQSLFSLWYVTL